MHMPSIVFSLPIQLRSGVIEWLWWAPDMQLGSAHPMEMLCPVSMFAQLQPALVPSAYSLASTVGTNIPTLHFKVQRCLARPTQSWEQHEYKLDTELHQFLCILLERENGEEKCHLEHTSKLSSGHEAWGHPHHHLTIP